MMHGPRFAVTAGCAAATIAAAMALQPWPAFAQAPGATPGPEVAAGALPGAPAAAALPTATAILDRYVEALGGEEAIRRHRSATFIGKFEMPGMGVEGRVEVRAAAPNLLHVVIESDDLGTLTQGFDGMVAWADNPMTGPMILEGAQHEATAIESDFYEDLNYEANYASIEVMSRESFAGEPCYEVKVTTPGGLEMLHYFSVESGLLVGVEGEQPTPMGNVWTTTRIGGYQELEGRLYPTETRQEAMGSEQVLTLTDADFGEVDRKWFELPDAIKTLASMAKDPPDAP